MYLVREFINVLFFKIGEVFGGKDYIIVFYVCEKIKEFINIDLNIRNVVEIIKKRFINRE